MSGSRSKFGRNGRYQDPDHAAPWLRYVQHCVKCDIVCIENNGGGLTFAQCPRCQGWFILSTGISTTGRIPEFQREMMQASGRYDGQRHFMRDGYWIRGRD